MKKIKYLVLCCLLLALILLCSGMLLGGFSQLKSTYFNSNDLLDVFDYEFEGIKKLDIDVDASKVIIEEYEGSSVKVTANKFIKVENNGDRLTLKDSFSFFNLNKLENEITVYIPVNYQFDDVSLNVDAGNFKVTNIYATDLKIEIDAGNFEAKKIVTENLDAEIDAGKAVIELLDCQNSDFDCDVSSLEIMMAGSEADYQYDINSDLGSIKIGNYKYDGFENEHHFGTGSRKIKINSDASDIEIKMEVS